MTIVINNWLPHQGQTVSGGDYGKSVTDASARVNLLLNFGWSMDLVLPDLIFQRK